MTLSALPMRVDQFEPTEGLTLISQSIPAERAPLNHAGFADYFWFDHQGRSIQVERKQWPEVLGGIDEVEDQLRREFPAADELYLLVEGVAEPSANGILTYKRAPTKPIYIPNHEYGDHKRPQAHLYHRVQAWFWSLDKAGITVLQTPNLGATATTLVAMYLQHQKPEHGVLNRYLKPRASLQPQNMCTRILLGVPDLGEARARKLADHFGSVGRICNATPQEIAALPGFGRVMGDRIIEYLWQV
jgi:hypothetical protein